ncbi:uncharacterized protein LOC127533651 [Acanthochromis polyacanthus]|uniref:uncharacterized protein LOC127533651 n=1 Tax=Acanthochromis polyacanthus TaxID=80966 RepID=UPI002234AE16|nr:uncharacterized protein LOC127533651 [Acanthochromis polyacanthus]
MALWRLLLVAGVTLSLLWLLFLSLSSTGTHRTKRTHEHSMAATWEQNFWYKAMNFTARQNNVTNCYVCSQLPHHATHQTIFTPIGLNKSETMCIFGESTLRMLKNFTGNMSYWFPNCTIHEEKWLDPTNFSQATNTTLGVGIAPLRTNIPFPLCLQRTCGDMYRHHLPGTPNCIHIISLSSNSSAILSSVPFVAGFNTSWWFSEDKYRTGRNITTFNLGPKISTPPEMMWQCGGLLYWYLPFDWCGTCTLVHLQPAVIVITDQQLENRTYIHTHRIQSRETKEEQQPAFSKPKRFLMSLVPSYGTSRLSASVNKLWFSLNNLTNAPIDITDQLENDPELKAIKQMTLQNRIALDLLLAAQGGVCEVVNDHCCTYIPDHKGNYTLIRQKLDEIKIDILRNQDKGIFPGWDFTSWFTSGGIFQTIKRFVVISICILLLFCIFATCILPCLRSMISKMITTSIIAYAALEMEEPQCDSNDENDDVEV